MQSRGNERKGEAEIETGPMEDEKKWEMERKAFHRSQRRNMQLEIKSLRQRG